MPPMIGHPHVARGVHPFLTFQTFQRFPVVFVDSTVGAVQHCRNATFRALDFSLAIVQKLFHPFGQPPALTDVIQDRDEFGVALTVNLFQNDVLGSTAISNQNLLRDENFLYYVELIRKHARLNLSGNSNLENFLVRDEETGEDVDVGTWLKHQKEKHDREDVDFTRAHLHTLRILNIPWAWYEPGTNMKIVAELQHFFCNCEILKDWIDTNRRMPSRSTVVGDIQIGRFVEKADQQYKILGHDYPTEKLQALAGAGVEWANHPPKRKKPKKSVYEWLKMLQRYFNSEIFYERGCLPDFYSYTEGEGSEGERLGLWICRQRLLLKATGDDYVLKAKFESLGLLWVLQIDPAEDCTRQVVETPNLLKDGKWKRPDGTRKTPARPSATPQQVTLNASTGDIQPVVSEKRMTIQIPDVSNTTLIIDEDEREVVYEDPELDGTNQHIRERTLALTKQAAATRFYTKRRRKKSNRMRHYEKLAEKAATHMTEQAAATRFYTNERGGGRRKKSNRIHYEKLATHMN